LLYPNPKVEITKVMPPLAPSVFGDYFLKMVLYHFQKIMLLKRADNFF